MGWWPSPSSSRGLRAGERGGCLLAHFVFYRGFGEGQKCPPSIPRDPCGLLQGSMLLVGSLRIGAGGWAEKG